MRFYFMLLWLAVVLLADTSAVVRSATDTAGRSLFAAGKEHPKRALRIDDVESEGRGAVPGLSTVARGLRTKVRSAHTYSKFDLWL
ncbi:hypothetical protein PHYSODRAFT_265123 [Phytophthora sojae]|uniref:RxLR effector protein n=2 Tax=Phytophthora sojae TaxID=67593 RepID=G4YHU5_PHYSP|nr:hypothetical protein PHYSODRAFT_265123 [Phytophthora sojae]AEK80936.1 Avh213 [Phytophthora sojae]AEK80937.1 Avh213 [Phytophthora sojae]AEK80938.1 Avh213 [Phytophthora sojae]EGZ29672.1 hypothetical protein PHYSODRAFT_265123 [Phytophthora sojae]|eukprot:XP_009516947.1 hypothetical protein PHYSODRAFT_265123 [Phytophthora sojae]